MPRDITNNRIAQPRARPSSRTFVVDALSQSSTTYSPSPLVAPAVCSLVLILPTDKDCSRKPADVRSGCHRNTTRLIAAAQIVAVPVFVCCREGKSKSFDCPHRAFACEAHGCIWKNEAFTKALDAEDCSALVLAGYWLDREVLTAALYALADRYEVYVPVDASPAHSRDAARLSEARLLHTGATPLLTKQVLHEWMIETSCAEKQAALRSLMK